MQFLYKVGGSSLGGISFFWCIIVLERILVYVYACVVMLLCVNITPLGVVGFLVLPLTILSMYLIS